ncbi:MAG: chloride channel protein [Kofleriaceae bacterium]
MRARWTFRFVLGIGVVAVAAAAFAIAFRASLAIAWDLAAGAGDVVSALTAAPWWLRILLPAAGAVVAGVLVRIAARRPESHGVGGVMEAVALGRVSLSLPVAVLRAAASWFAIACGGSLGREGALIQFGGAAGGDLGARLSLALDERRVLVAAGTAAGFAAAYNTPLAAVAFVLEVVAGVVVIDTIVPTLVATVIATALTRLAVGEGPIYGLRAFVFADPRELVAFGLLGVVCAFAGLGFMRLVGATDVAFRRIPTPWRQALGGLGAGAIIAVVPAVAGNGYEPLGAILDGKLAILTIAWLVLAKSFATAASVGSGTPGGMFTPSMLIGGCLGYLVGVGLDAAGFAVSAPGGYALVGMAAAVAATTHAPLMAAVLAFEVSGDYGVVLPLVLATAIATAIARKLGRDSVYTAELRARGITWELTMSGRRVTETNERDP